MTKIIKATSKGQITIPAEWRREFKTDQFIIIRQKDGIKIKPININKIMEEEKNRLARMKEYEKFKKNRPKNETVIFDAIRDNNGEGISADDFIKMIEEIDG
ncbi:MAG: AbrB/MazE/SpoVT family DNA-binding domain-containing protein [Patescibacteria group bacterium]|nr:AbrB/MazE/SpoVT family DNA-binding domain-containing protein [Patescibacteria group bacterium]